MDAFKIGYSLPGFSFPCLTIKHNSILEGERVNALAKLFNFIVATYIVITYILVVDLHNFQRFIHKQYHVS